MGHIHAETLAQYQTTGAVYCYGYGGMRQLMQSLENGSIETYHLVAQMKEIISAVEFRTAEIMAEVIMETEKLTAHIEGRLKPVQSHFPTAVERTVDGDITPPYAH